MTQFVRYRAIPPIVVFCAYGFAAAQKEKAIEEGDLAPDFSIVTDQGKRISKGASGGKLLVLNFWETACAPCAAELPSLTAFADKFRSNQVVVLAVSGDEDPQKYNRFLHDHRIGLETYRDPTRRISRSFGTLMFPETYIIQNGRVVRKVVGSIDWMSDDISSFVHKRLAQ